MHPKNTQNLTMKIKHMTRWALSFSLLSAYSVIALSADTRVPERAYAKDIELTFMNKPSLLEKIKTFAKDVRDCVQKNGNSSKCRPPFIVLPIHLS
jgi:hypothetical protein